MKMKILPLNRISYGIIPWQVGCTFVWSASGATARFGLPHGIIWNWLNTYSRFSSSCWLLWLVVTNSNTFTTQVSHTPNAFSGQQLWLHVQHNSQYSMYHIAENIEWVVVHNEFRHRYGLRPPYVRALWDGTSNFERLTGWGEKSNFSGQPRRSAQGVVHVRLSYRV